VLLLAAAVGADSLACRHASAGPTGPPATGEKKPEPKGMGGRLPVNPTFELPGMIREFEQEKPVGAGGLEESAIKDLPE